MTNPCRCNTATLHPKEVPSALSRGVSPDSKNFFKNEPASRWYPGKERQNLVSESLEKHVFDSGRLGMIGLVGVSSFHCNQSKSERLPVVTMGL